ncbi:MAG: hydrogenase maturation nickel metallochaperone HypA [Candidatus Hydrothermarchaeota archaeon]
MHELAFASNILEKIKKEAKKHKAHKVISVELNLGELLFLDPEQLKFLLETLIDDDIIKGADFKIKMQKAEGECNCGYTGPLDYKEESHQLIYIKCPVCNGMPEIRKGNECIIEKINMEVEDSIE